MSEFPFTESDLRAAALAVSDSMLASLPGPNEIEHEFSETFLKKMDALLAKDRRHLRIQAIVRRAAIIVLAVLVSLGAWLAVDTEARAAVRQWVREQWTGESGISGFAYRFFTSGRGRELPGYSVFRDTRCVIAWMPEGYEDQQHDYLDNGEIHYFVKKGLAEGIFFSWAFFNEEEPPQFYYGVREGESQRVMIRGNAGEYIPDGDGTGGTLHWLDAKSGIQMELHSAFDRKTMLRIARSITAEETPDLPEYAPAWIPDGFIEQDVTQGRHYCARSYWNADERSKIQLSYSFTRESEEYGYVVEQGREFVESVTIHGYAADFYPANADTPENLLVWMEEERGIFFRLQGSVSKTDMIQMAESVSLVKALE